MTIREADPIVEIINFIRDEINESIKKIPINRLGTVVSINPLLILPDGFGQPFDFAKGDILVSDHLRLEVNDRVLLMPLNFGSQYWVLSKFSLEQLPLNANIGHTVSDTFVGLRVFSSSDNVTRYPTLFALTWNTIRGSVGGVLRILTHLLHYHVPASNPITTGSASVGDHGTHTHSVTLPNTGIATNPE